MCDYGFSKERHSADEMSVISHSRAVDVGTWTSTEVASTIFTDRYSVLGNNEYTVAMSLKFRDQFISINCVPQLPNLFIHLFIHKDHTEYTNIKM